MLRTDRLVDTVRGHKKSIMLAGTALALASAGTASAATVATPSPGPQAAALITVPAHTDALTRPAIDAATPRRRGGTRAAASHPAAMHAAARHAASRHAGSHYPAPHHAAPHHAAAHHAAPQHHATAHRAAKVVTWGGVSGLLNRETNPADARRGVLPPADKLLPTALTGAQSWMPISPAQYANATTIVRQALARRMGVRSAVIAVATAMQESRLINVDYGTSDSVGLFQQRPSCGWGTAAQVMDPAYAAGAFMNALQRYQSGDPYWAGQPLYQAAQGVQGSAFPYAYAQWEAQAAHLVQSIAMQVR